MTSQLAFLAAALLAAPALGQEPEEPPPADGEPEVRLWKETCDLDGKGGGELLRVSGTSSAGNMSQGRETYRVLRGTDVVVELTQEGRPQVGPGATVAEGDRWIVECSRNAIRVRAGEAELRLALSGKAAAIDAKWLHGFSAEKGRDLPLATLERTSALLDGVGEAPPVGKVDEAGARVGLLIAERALDAGDTDRAEQALQQADSGRLPALAAWARRVAERLDAARGAPPILAHDPARIGTVGRSVTVPVGKAGDGELGREPDVYWSGASLCLRDGERGATMRCWQPDTAKWGEAAPYVSPYAAGPRLSSKYLGHPGGYATRLTLEDGAGERVVAEVHSPSILARDVRGGLVVRSAGRSPAEQGGVSVRGYDAASGAGSVLAGGGKFFFDGPATLRSVAQPGRSWKVGIPGREAGVVCASEPLTSPDEKRAACLVRRETGKSSTPEYELWVFDLGEPPPKRQ